MMRTTIPAGLFATASVAFTESAFGSETCVEDPLTTACAPVVEPAVPMPGINPLPEETCVQVQAPPTCVRSCTAPWSGSLWPPKDAAVGVCVTSPARVQVGFYCVGPCPTAVVYLCTDASGEWRCTRAIHSA